MKTAMISVVLLGTVAVPIVGWLQIDRSVRANIESSEARRVLHYVDPMHPAYTSPWPGIAPDCGMQLQPVYADAIASKEVQRSRTHRTSVKLTREQQQFVGVRVETVERTTGGYAVRLFGRVAADEARVYQVNVGLDGYLRDVSAATTGRRVDKGQWLATISAPDARQPIQAYLVALDVLDRARKTAEAPAQIAPASAAVQQTTDRLLTIGMSPLQIGEIRETRIVPANVRITAPAAGFVLARNATIGQPIERGTELFRIADLRRVWIHANAFGVDADAVVSGLEAEVIVPGRNRSVRARVADVLPQFDPASQSLTVRLEAENADYVLRPEMVVEVALQVPTAPAITVSREALVQTGREAIVFVERGDREFEARQVRTGWRSGDRIEITSGLEPGDRVAISGTFLLNSERRMRLIGTAAGEER